MIRLAAMAALAGIAINAPVSAQTLVVALSADQVEITSNFTGASVTVFGAIENASERDMAAGWAIAVLLRGPDEAVTTRRKERVLGIWINRTELVFSPIPSFYALHTTAPLAELADRALLAEIELGLSTIVGPAIGATGADEDDFAAAMVRLQQDRDHFVERVDLIDRPSSGTFRTDFALPAEVPIGRYAVEVFLFRFGEAVATASVPLEISKTGVEQFVYAASREAPWLYALAVVVFAAGAGWLGGVAFRRD